MVAFGSRERSEPACGKARSRTIAQTASNDSNHQGWRWRWCSGNISASRQRATPSTAAAIAGATATSMSCTAATKVATSAASSSMTTRGLACQGGVDMVGSHRRRWRKLGWARRWPWRRWRRVNEWGASAAKQGRQERRKRWAQSRRVPSLPAAGVLHQAMGRCVERLQVVGVRCPVLKWPQLQCGGQATTSC